MRAITVKQPWAWAIAHGGKSIENRSRGTTYRGPLAIHAGLAWSERGATDTRVIDAIRGDRQPEGYYDPPIHVVAEVGRAGFIAVRPTDPRYATGVVIAVAELADAHPDAGCCRPWGESSYTEASGRKRTAVHHLILEDIRPLPAPLACRGALGYWRLPADVLELLPGGDP